MNLIVAGAFEQRSDAARAVDALLRGGVRHDSVCMFALDPAGQRAALPIGGDHHASPGAIDAGTGAAVGACTGSPAEALVQMSDADEASSGADRIPARPAGIMVAVNASHSLTEALAIAVMRRFRAKEIERVHGVWRDGVWEDFDPITARRRVPPTSLSEIAKITEERGRICNGAAASGSFDIN